MTRRELLSAALLLPLTPVLRVPFAVAQNEEQALKLENLFSFHPQFRGREARPIYQPTSLFNFTGGESTFNDLVNVVVNIIAQPELSVPALRLEQASGLATVDLPRFGKFLTAHLVNALKLQPNYAKIEEWEKQWLIAEGICEWVKRALRYDYGLVRREEQSKTEIESIARTDMKNLLSLPQPMGSCWHFALATRDLARAAGLKAYIVNGHYRGFGETASAFEARNHSVVIFEINGMEMPADVTSAATRFHQKNSMIATITNRKVGSQYVMPRDTTAWNLFLASFNAEVNLKPHETLNGDEQNKHLKCTYKYAQWSALNTVSFQQIDQEYLEWEVKGREL